MSELPSGFSENPTNPFANPTDEYDPVKKAGATRIGPYMKFDASRFYQRSPSVPIASYGDGWFKYTTGGVEQYPCYAYFSTTGRDRRARRAWASASTPTPTAAG